MNAGTLVVPSYPASEPRLQSILGPFLLAYVLTVLGFVVCGYLWGGTGFDLLVVGMGWPHVILGFLFYFNKVLKNEGAQRTTFFLLLALTVAISILHTLIPITTLIFLYFVFHAFRDEIFLYHQRRTGHRFSGPVFNRGGWALLIGLLVAAGIGQFEFRPTLRTVEAPANRLVAGKNLTLAFPAIEHSQGRTFYFYLEVPHWKGTTPIASYATASDTRRDGRLLVSEKPWRADDLEFQEGYQGETPAASDPRSHRRVLLAFGGYPVAQTFRALADNLSSISVPIVLLGEVPQDLKLVLRIERAFFVSHPYCYELGLCLLGTVFALLGVFRVPRALFRRMPALQFAAPALLLFAMAMVTMKFARMYEKQSPLFFAFLVVFHYFSWYVFALEKIQQRPSPPARGLTATAMDRFLQAMGTRNGFLTLMVALNAVSFVGAYAYHVLNLSSTLQYLFSLKYFLYFLVFHVTMSFAPKRAPQRTAA